MPPLPGFLYDQGFGSVELLSGMGIEWSDMGGFRECDRCGSRDACDGTCIKADALDQAEVVRDG
jgi:hypothetical protein